MKLEYKLNVDDYLQHQLYTASKTKRIKNQRRKSHILVSLCFFIISLFFFEKDKFMFYGWIFIGIISLIFYPYYLRNYYKKHYLKYIQDTFKNRFEENLIVEFFENEISTNDANSESKINYSALEEINEIKNHIFLKLKSGGSFIIPKSKIADLTALKTELKNIREKNNLPQNIELDWKWK